MTSGDIWWQNFIFYGSEYNIEEKIFTTDYAYVDGDRRLAAFDIRKREYVKTQWFFLFLSQINDPIGGSIDPLFQGQIMTYIRTFGINATPLVNVQ